MEIECAHCGSKKLIQIPGTWTPMPIMPQATTPGPAIPLVILGCPTCGFIQMFSPEAIAPHPFPDQGPGSGSA